MPRQKTTTVGGFDLGDSVTAQAADAGQAVSIGASSVQSAVFGYDTRAVRLVATSDCWIEISGNPTAAATTSFFLPSGAPEYFRAGVNDKVAVIQASAGGTLYARPVN